MIIPLEGKQLSAHEFQPIFRDTVNAIKTDDLRRVVMGSAPVLVVEAGIPNEVRQVIRGNFENIIATLGSDRIDGVPVNQIGPNQYGLPFGEYVARAQQLRGKVDALFEGVDPEMAQAILGENWLEPLFRDMGGFPFRAAEENNVVAARCVAREWRDKGELALKPHSDNQQVRNSPQNGELLHVQRVLGYNFCVENSSNGGELILWNIEPAAASLEALDREYAGSDLAKNGYPYHPDVLQSFDKLEIPIKSGYRYIINGHLPHAVRSAKDGLRLTLTKFIGSCVSLCREKIIQWT